MIKEHSLFFRTVVLGTAYFFVIGAFNVVGAVTNSFIVHYLGAQGIPFVELLKSISASLFCAFVIYHRLLRLRLSTTIGAINLCCLAFVSVVPWLISFERSRNLVIVLLALAASMLITCGVYCVWMLLTSTVTTSSGKYFTIFATMPQIAMIATAHLTRFLLGVFTPSQILYFGVAGYGIALGLIIYAMLKFSCSGGRLEDFEEVEQDGTESPLRAMVRMLKLPYIRFLSLVIITQVAFGTIINWRIYKFAENYDTVSAATAMLTSFNEYVGWGALACQLIVVPLTFRWLTPRYGLLLMPLVGICAWITIALSVSQNLIFLAIAIHMSFDYTLNNCMREALYIPLPLQSKVHFKSIIAILVPRVGAVVSALALLVVTRLGMVFWYLSLLAIATAWVTAALIVLNLYAKYLRQSKKQITAADVDEIKPLRAGWVAAD